MSHTNLIDAATLLEHLGAEGAGTAQRAQPWIVLDCRTRLDDATWGHKAWAQGHIPGAVYVSLAHDLAAPPGRGGRHPLPPRSQWLACARAAGINDHQQVVVYDDAGGAFAARAWWLLRWLGHAPVAVLDGGLPAWTGTLTTDAPTPTPGDLADATPLVRSIDLSPADLPAHTLLDARAQARFEGKVEPIDPVAGHIPGALCKPFEGNLHDGYFLPPKQLRARFADVAGGQTVHYCGSGVTACHNILACHIAGLPEGALYPGSWSGWITDPAHPVEP